jgi:hypothetical protein
MGRFLHIEEVDPSFGFVLGLADELAICVRLGDNEVTTYSPLLGEDGCHAFGKTLRASRAVPLVG